MQKVRKYINNIRIIPFLILNFFIFSPKAYTQEIAIFTGKTSLALNEKFTVTIYFPKDNKRDFKVYQNYFFPDIDDFEKGRTAFLEVDEPKGYKITQYYKPRKAGNFEVNPIHIKVKDKFYTSKKAIVKVSSKTTKKPDSEPEIKLNDKLEFDEPKLEILFDLQATKSRVYSGEGVGITLSFLISTSNKAEITFIDLAEQRKEFLKKLKPANCFIEDFSIANQIIMDTVTVKDKKYTRWKLYEGVFFPLDSNAIKIPAVNFSILTYSLAKNKHQSIERRVVLKRVATKPVLLKVMALPNNRGSQQVPVGYFKLNEEVSSAKFHTGKSFKYTFTIVGEGNIATLPAPSIISSENFDIYAPKITQQVSRHQGKITGVKSFVYNVTPKEPGDFLLSDYIKWSYFNTAKSDFDTLSSSVSLKVRGESLKNNYISANNPGDFYSRINTDNNQLRLLAKDTNLKLLANVFILIMLVITGILVLKK